MIAKRLNMKSMMEICQQINYNATSHLGILLNMQILKWRIANTESLKI